MRDEAERIVLVTGASSGLGAEVARGLAHPDTHVVVHCRRATGRADAVAEAVRAAGGRASTLVADLSDDAGVDAMMTAVHDRFGRLDAMVLTTARGDTAGLDAHDAMRANREVQRRLAQRAVPVMPPGGRIVFATSHQAHFFPHKAVPKGCAAIAAGQRAGETALYTMRATLARAGIALTVVSAEMADGCHPQEISEFTQAIVGAVRSAYAPSIIYAGRADFLRTA